MSEGLDWVGSNGSLSGGQGKGGKKQKLKGKCMLWKNREEYGEMGAL